MQRDKHTLELNKWGRHWVAQLRVTPTDGTFPDGYVVTHERVKGGRKAFPKIQKMCAERGIDVQIREEALADARGENQ